MRKLAFGLALVFAIGLIAVPAMAEEGTFTADGDVRMRYDYLSNYLDADDDGDDTYDIWPYRARIGVMGNFSDRIWGRVELQAAGWFGDNTFESTYPYPSSSGLPSSTDGQVDLYQAFVTVEGATWDFTAGRKEHTIGNELILGDNDFYNGLVFDGLTAEGDYSSWDLAVFWHEINETGALREDEWLAGINADIDLLGGLRPYILYQKSFAPAFQKNLWTFGIGWDHPVNEDKKGWDLNIEIAGQTGDGFGGLPAATAPDGLDFGGYIVESWFGWGFGSAGRVHIGYFLASGDDGTDATSNDAWQPLFEDPHANNRLGNLDLFAAGFVNTTCDRVGDTCGMTNVQDISLGYDWWGSDNHAMIAFHSLSRVETTLARPDDDIGIELDLAYERQYAENASFLVGISTLFSGDNLKGPGPNAEDPDNITRAYAQLHLSWGK